LQPADDPFTVAVSLSPEIAAVGIVDWSADTAIESAHIDFGRDPGAFEFTAPIDHPDSAGNRTLLLGMKPETTYSLRVVAEGDGSSYESKLHQITTGPAPNGLPPMELSTHKASGLYEGFTIACTFDTAGVRNSDTSGNSWTFIIDSDGTYVWWYQSAAGGQDCVRARMSYDGQYMWIANANVPGPSNGTLVRVSMDGTEERSYDVPWRHHDVAILPDEAVAYFEYKEGGASPCDVVKELHPDTEAVEVVYDVAQANSSQASSCHTNAINWWPDQELYTLSVMEWNSIIAFSRSGVLSWIFGGAASDYPGVSWVRQHQHHLLSNGILLFNNAGSDGASVLEYRLNETSAKLVHDYANGHTTQSMGGVKRLPNGNALVTYSNQGVIQEVDSSWQLLQEITTLGVGYTVRRNSLYGPPPPYSE
jgi:hypothetical protein